MGLGDLGGSGGLELERLERTEALEAHARGGSRRHALSDQRDQRGLVAAIAEHVGHGLVGGGLRVEQGAVDLLGPQIAGDIVGGVRSGHMGEQRPHPLHALRAPAVELAHPDVAGAAVLDVPGALPVGGEAHEHAEHAVGAEPLGQARRIHAVL